MLPEGCNLKQDCISTTAVPDWLESPAVAGFKVWQIMFISCAGVLTVVIVLCCCIRFRIPRTKQEIEADYVRKKITNKFKKQLKMIHNADMDEMDLKRALDRIRAEFKSDTESLAQSDALSGATLSSGNFHLPGDLENTSRHHESASYRKASDIGITFDELVAREQKKKEARFSLSGMMTKFRTSSKPKEVSG